MLLKFDGSWDLMEEGIRVAYLQYADIINVSSASECDWACKTLGCVNDEFSDLFNINCVSALTKIIEHVANEGVLVVVLSSNIVPCTQTRALCVGATNTTDDRRADYSNYGDRACGSGRREEMRRRLAARAVPCNSARCGRCPMRSAARTCWSPTRARPNSDIGRVTNRFSSPRLGRRQPELAATTRLNPCPGIDRGPPLFFVRCMEAALRF